MKTEGGAGDGDRGGGRLVGGGSLLCPLAQTGLSPDGVLPRYSWHQTRRVLHQLGGVQGIAGLVWCVAVWCWVVDVPYLAVLLSCYSNAGGTNTVHVRGRGNCEM